MADGSPKVEMGRTAAAPEWLRGSFTPLITPFSDGAVDYSTYERLVERQIRGGSDGIVVTGTTGEPTSLSLDERVELVRRAVAICAGALPVVAATGTLRLDETIDLSRRAQDAGADAVMIVAPGFVKPSAAGMIAYFKSAVAAVDVPALLYNIPGRAGVTITPDVVIAVADECRNLVGVKTASADLDYVAELLQLCGPQFRIFCGLESYTWPMMAVGACGVMSAVGNLLPREVAELCRAAASGDTARARELHFQLFSINKAIFLDTNPGPLKTMMALSHVAKAEVRPPLATPSPKTIDALRKVLDAYTIDPMTASQALEAEASL